DKEREEAFYERQQQRIEKMRAARPDAALPPIRPYAAAPTFYKQISTSLKTVMTGFVIAAVVAIPLGIAIGLSGPLYSAVNPLIQLFKPVSPLAWLPLVTLVVSAVYSSPSASMPKS